jgi:D-glycero-alpha-D-manno-heptose-7-phosphate kinase
MLISRTPFKVSLFGGGTDLPVWLDKNKGKVFSLAVNKYCYITVRNLNEFFDYKYAITYHKREHVSTFKQIKHPVVKNLIKMYGKKLRLEIEHKSDLPARSGIGSSSSFSIGLLNSFLSKNKQISKKNLSEKAIYLEQKILKESVGIQDQIRAAYGGMGFINMSKNKFNVNNFKDDSATVKEIEDSIILVYTDLSRNASEIEAEKIKNLKKDKKTFNNMKFIYDVACEAEKNLLSKNFNLNEIGSLLSEQWKYKKKLSHNISNKKIDDIYDSIINDGAYGGKLLGAGSGGFMVFLVKKSVQKKIFQKAKNLKVLKIKTDFIGSTIFNSSV